MSNPFDRMTLYECDVMVEECFDGKSITDVNPFDFAGGVLYIIKKRDNPELDWESFRRVTPMSEIKQLSQELNEDDEEMGNPMNGAVVENV